MTDQPEYTLDGAPLLVCSTAALHEALASPYDPRGWPHSWGKIAAIAAELATREDWRPPYGGMCVP